MSGKPIREHKQTENPTVPMTKEMLERVREVAKLDGRTVSETIRRLIERGLKDNDREVQPS